MTTNNPTTHSIWTLNRYNQQLLQAEALKIINLMLEPHEQFRSYQDYEKFINRLEVKRGREFLTDAEIDIIC